MARGLSQRAHHKVLEAATKLFAERGIDATSVDAIAAASGVSKATVYKHWADKDALCLEVLVHVHELDEGPPELDSGDLREDLKAFLKYEPSPKESGHTETVDASSDRLFGKKRTVWPSLESAGDGTIARLFAKIAATRCGPRDASCRAGRRARRCAAFGADDVQAYFWIERGSRVAGGGYGELVLESACAAGISGTWCR